MIGLLRRGTRRPHPNPFPLPLGRLPGLIDSRELHLCNLKVLRYAVEVGEAAGDGHLACVVVARGTRRVVQALCAFWFVDGGPRRGEFGWCLVAVSGVWSVGLVVDPPVFADHAGLEEAVEPPEVQ